jgi:hypothetical protein
VQATEAETADGGTVAVTSSVYPCSNPACNTAIVVRLSLTGGYLPSDVASGRLHGDDAAAFIRGRTSQDGIWKNRAGDPRTAPVQRDLFAV